DVAEGDIVEDGQTLAIVGHTGSGKSTIAALTGRLYDPVNGRISIDGVDVSEHNLSELRTSIGYVPQEVFLFSDTIANNISFGIKGIANREQVEQAAKDACIHENIIEFKEGYETLLGERGITLSGGQKQRVSIARAIIKEPKILIFDDCLSAVDTETEDRILNNLQRIMRNKTTILISHRVSTVKQANTIIVLNEGEIVETGTHRELLENRGRYYELYQKQLLEESNLTAS
ncbi:MAG: ATP-binding cassette domain-containing protein, partial [Bacteroidota bacterium]